MTAEYYRSDTFRKPYVKCCSKYALAENYFNSMFQGDEHIPLESTTSFQRNQPLSSKIGINGIDIDSPALGLSYWLMLGQPFHSIFIFLDCTLEVTDGSQWLCGEHRGLTPTLLGHYSDKNVELASVDHTWSLHLSDATLFFPAFGKFRCQYLTLLLSVRKKKNIVIYTTKQANEKWPGYYNIHIYFLIQNIAMKYLPHSFDLSQANIISLLFL